MEPVSPLYNASPLYAIPNEEEVLPKIKKIKYFIKNREQPWEPYQTIYQLAKEKHYFFYCTEKTNISWTLFGKVCSLGIPEFVQKILTYSFNKVEKTIYKEMLQLSELYAPFSIVIVNVANSYGWTPLFCLATKCSDKALSVIIAGYLIDSGAYVNASTSAEHVHKKSLKVTPQSATPLWAALESGNELLATFLIKNQAIAHPSLSPTAEKLFKKITTADDIDVGSKNSLS